MAATLLTDVVAVLATFDVAGVAGVAGGVVFRCSSSLANVLASSRATASLAWRLSRSVWVFILLYDHRDSNVVVFYSWHLSCD